MNNPEPLHFPKFMDTELNVFYTAGAVTRITHMMIQNNHTLPVNAKVYIVPPQMQVSDEYLAFDGLVAPKQSKVVYQVLGRMMGTDWSLQAQASEPGVAALSSSGTYKT